jgi:hypothetical protein
VISASVSICRHCCSVVSFSRCLGDHQPPSQHTLKHNDTKYVCDIPIHPTMHKSSMPVTACPQATHATVKPNGRDPGSRTELAVSVARRGVQRPRQHMPHSLQALLLVKRMKNHVDGLIPAWRAMAAKIAATGMMLRARCTCGYSMSKTRLVWIISYLSDGELGLGAGGRNHRF